MDRSPPPDDERSSASSVSILFLIIAAVVAAPVTVGAVDAGPSDRIEGETTAVDSLDPGNNTTVRVTPGELTKGELDLRDTQGIEPRTRTGDGLDRRVQLVVELSNATPHPPTEYVSRLRSMGATVEARYERDVQITLSLERLGSLRSKDWVRVVRRPIYGVSLGGQGDVVSEGVESMRADVVQNQGITGASSGRGDENVQMGIIGIEGFDTTNPEIEGNVEFTKSYKGGIQDGGPHGTALAEIGVDVAPDNYLNLVNYDTVTEFKDGLQTLRAENVDVVAIAVGYFLQPENGDGEVAQAVDRAVTGQGDNPAVPVVAAAGNFAGLHWRGAWSDANSNRILDWEGTDESNTLNGGRSIDEGDRIRAYLKWDAWPTTDQDYDLYVVDSDGNTVARSTRTQDGDDRPIEYVDFQAPATDTYHVVVKNVDATGDATLEMYFAGPVGEYTTAASSVTAPATADHVIGVGAYDVDSGSPSGFSSVGPTNDGERAVDVAGPSGVAVSSYDRPFAGTSAAAPHVAGTVALLRAADPTLSPSEIESVLTNTARDIGPDGVDRKSGYGRVDAAEAVDRVTDIDSDPPAVGTFGMSGNGQSLDVTVESNESLGGISVGITDDRGTTVATLDRSDFAENGTTYTASVDVSGSGTYTATLSTVTDDVGNDELPGTTASATVEDGNEAPTADAGPNQSVDEGGNVTLDATGSSDPDGDSLSFSWTQTGGPDVLLWDGGTATPRFTAPAVNETTTLTFAVTASDGNGASDTDDVTVTVTPDPETPTADAGTNRSVEERTTVALDATGSSDPSGDSLSYAWTQTGGPDVRLDDASGATPTFTAPDVRSNRTLTFEVTVSDGDGNHDTDTVAITVEPSDTGDDFLSRSVALPTVQAGTSVDVTLSMTFGRPQQRLSIQDAYTGPVGSVEITSVTLNSSPMPGGKLLFSRSGPESLEAVLTDIPANATVELTYSLTVADGAEEGANVTFTGADDEDVESERAGGEFGTDTTTVGTLGEPNDGPAVRTLSSTTVVPGESIEVTLEADIDEPQDALRVRDSVIGPVGGFEFTSVTVDGTDVESGKVILTRERETGGTIAFQDLPAGTLSVTYTVDVNASASVGDRITFVGDEDDVDVSGRTFEGEFARDVAIVQAETGVLARLDGNGDGTIDDGELQTAIGLWVEGDIGDEALQKVISAWVEGGD